jgi:phage tail sheath protein FI
MGDRVAILDAPPGLNAQQIKEWRVDKAGYDSKYAALYWPWVKVFDPSSGKPKFVPPSGHMAGIWARSDDERGVHKAPANEVVRGAIALELQITKGEHDQLNPSGINVIRAFPGRGIRVWGARTLSSDPAWRYLNVRRLFNYVEESILEGTQWVVFEPNDLDLWQRVKRTANSFLLGVWRDGALFGATPGEAFYVKCDSETNPPDVIDRGQLVVEIGIAPVKPAEFVIFRIAQFSGGAALSE